jgi:hypothetical protein
MVVLVSGRRMNANEKRKAKRVIAEIVRLANGDRVLPRVRLIKTFYLAHACYAKSNPDRLTGWPIDEVPTAEDIQSFQQMLLELMEERVIGETHSIIYADFRSREIDPVTDRERASILTAINQARLRRL